MDEENRELENTGTPETEPGPENIYEPIGSANGALAQAGSRKGLIAGIIITSLVALVALALLIVFWLAPAIATKAKKTQDAPPAQESARTERNISALNRVTEFPDTMPELGRAADDYSGSAEHEIPADIFENIVPSVVCIARVTFNQDGTIDTSASVGYGTGFFITSDGYIMTNSHVVESAENFAVITYDGAMYEAAYVGRDPGNDIAILKIDGHDDFIPVPLGDSDDVRTGETVIAIGNPAGADELLIDTLTVGHVSAVSRGMKIRGFRNYVIQTDAAINPGNSGGPLIDYSGNVIGVVYMKSLYTPGSGVNQVDTEGLGFAIPINTALNCAEKIILGGDVRKPGIGLTYYDIDEQVAAAYHLDVDKGAYVVEVSPDGPADDAGILAGDVIVGCDGKKYEELGSIAEYVSSHSPGDRVTFSIYRQGSTFDVEIVLRDLNNID